MPLIERSVVIADDEPAARRGVRQLLAAWPAWQVRAECRDGASVLAALDTAIPDALFLDIQMPGIDGLEVVRRRQEAEMPAVVFLTAYEEFALRGFDAQALDYLVKPVSEARFAQTMRRLERHVNVRASGSGDVTLAVATARGVIRIDLDDIDWIEASDNYARIWIGARSWLLRESLQRLERRLRHAGFCRAHRRALVRIAGVRRLQRAGNEGMVAVLASGVEIPISRRQRASMLARIRS